MTKHRVCAGRWEIRDKSGKTVGYAVRSDRDWFWQCRDGHFYLGAYRTIQDLMNAKSSQASHPRATGA